MAKIPQRQEVCLPCQENEDHKQKLGTKDQGMKVLIEVFDEDESQDRRLIDVPAEGTTLLIDSSGRISRPTLTGKCMTCGGSGGVRYWYAQDESVVVNCPLCSHGNAELWEIEKKRWKATCHI